MASTQQTRTAAPSSGVAGHTKTTYLHLDLPCGAELAVAPLPRRQTVGLCFRVLTGLADEPDDLTGIGEIVENTLSKGTQKYDGRALADAFDALGAQWSSTAGRQSMLLRLVCLPEYTLQATALVAEMLVRPTFPDEACRVAVDLAQQALKHLEDEPGDLVRVMMQRVALGPVLGRHPGGTPESLARITPDAVRAHWRRSYHVGRLQVTAAGPVDADALAATIDREFAGLGETSRGGRDPVPHTWTPAREHRQKELEQQHIALALPGLPKHDPDFAVELVLLGVLSGGMSGRLFTEVREKQGLVYWVGAWHAQPRDQGVLYVGASSTPDRCRKTYDTLLRELRRLGQDLTEEEVARARDQIIAQAETEDDLTRARAAGLSDDLFHFGRPVGIEAKLDAVRAVTLERAVDYARRLPVDKVCVCTLGPREMT
ncbi:MAG: insulinase family protein [Phycisphaerales bacterium]|nr:insulinase family protein [Phycisphaerales bacterium]